MIKSLKTEKPSKNKIEAWLKDELDITERNEVILGLLQHKDKETLHNLDIALFPEKYSENETIFKWFNKLGHKLTEEVNKFGEKISLLLNPTESDLHPQMLGSKKDKHENSLTITSDKGNYENIKDGHSIKLKANSDFEFTIKLAEDNYIISLMFANSNNENGFIFPNMLKDEVDPVIHGPQSNFSILKKRSYSLKSNENTTFIYTQTIHSEEKANYFKKCVQLGEQLGMVRWLKFIEGDENGEFSIAKIEIASEDK